MLAVIDNLAAIIMAGAWGTANGKGLQIVFTIKLQ